MTLLTLLLGSFLEAATVDRVAAVVNDDLIVLSSVYEVGAEYLTDQIGTEDLRSAELEVLNTLIQRLLVSQELQGLGMDVTEEEVEGAMNDIAESNGIARSELRSEVEDSGLDWEAYQGEIQESLRQMKFNQLILQPRIVVDDKPFKSNTDRSNFNNQM
jgi:peptidyl-prolyl cis-trans isomerase SurA